MNWLSIRATSRLSSSRSFQLILPISIARGAGGMYLGGDTLNFGNQWVLSFQRKADKILVIRKNVGVKAKSGSPQADSIKVSYNDSVIAALPIKSATPTGNNVATNRIAALQLRIVISIPSVKASSALNPILAARICAGPRMMPPNRITTAGTFRP